MAVILASDSARKIAPWFPERRLIQAKIIMAIAFVLALAVARILAIRFSPAKGKERL